MDNSSNFETIVVINCILNAPLMLTSITGNALVLATIFRTPSLRSVPSTIFLCSLAITDFLVGFVAQPVYIANELQYSAGGPLYKVENFISVSLCGVSLLTVTAIISIFSPPLSCDVSEFDDHKTCNEYFSKSLVCFHTFFMP